MSHGDAIPLAVDDIIRASFPLHGAPKKCIRFLLVRFLCGVALNLLPLLRLGTPLPASALPLVGGLVAKSSIVFVTKGPKVD